LDEGGELHSPREGERREAAIEHLDWLVGALGPRAGLRHARKHLAAYAHQAGADDALRRALVTTEDPSQARRLLARAFDGDWARLAA
ncbi:MAG: tRNA-dihydrouridine synthase, partial [Roseiarcus sp.]